MHKLIVKFCNEKVRTTREIADFLKENGYLNIKRSHQSSILWRLSKRGAITKVGAMLYGPANI